jgi:GNAT superfamily N-acetyltransferase
VSDPADAGLTFREGTPSDLRATFELSQRAWDASRAQRGLFPEGQRREPSELDQQWRRWRPLLEFLSAQPGGGYWLCEDGTQPVGYARVANFGAIDELTELWVAPEFAGRGVGRALLSRCWPEPPTPDLGRLVLTIGTPTNLTLSTDFGVMPVSGHWHLRHRAEGYLERRALETDAAEPAVHVLTAERAVEEWKRLEPAAIGHERGPLHEFFGRTRTCLATMDAERGLATGLCWVSSDGQIGPAVGETAEDLIPVVLVALDRVAKAQEPVELGVYCMTDAWWLLDRLRRLGFRVHWPSWVMCSVPLPGLDRYLASRPPLLL